ncbi:MAG: UPF0158 family protein [Pleomorphochaeta sp.]
MEKTYYKLPVLNSYLLKNIIFSMENQGSIGYLDLENAEVVEVVNINDSVIVRENKKSDNLVTLVIKNNKDRFLALPPWGSIEGFKIREQFIKDMKNPVYKKTLNHVFHTGRGVFKKFKQVLKENPIIERQWLDFKSKYMKAIVINWYKECEGYINLNNMDEEFEELPNDLLISDFVFSTKIDKNVEKNIAEIQSTIINELDFFEKLIVNRREEIIVKPNYLLAYNLEDNLVGFIKWEELDSSSVEITSYGIYEEYRGLGLFTLMMDKLMRELSRKKYNKVVFFKGKSLSNYDLNLNKNDFVCDFGYSIIDINSWNMDKNSSELVEV